MHVCDNPERHSGNPQREFHSYPPAGEFRLCWFVGDTKEEVFSTVWMSHEAIWQIFVDIGGFYDLEDISYDQFGPKLKDERKTIIKVTGNDPICRNMPNTRQGLNGTLHNLLAREYVVNGKARNAGMAIATGRLGALQIYCDEKNLEGGFDASRVEAVIGEVARTEASPVTNQDNSSAAEEPTATMGDTKAAHDKERRKNNKARARARKKKPQAESGRGKKINPPQAAY